MDLKVEQMKMVFVSQHLGQEEGIPFSNSLAVSDYLRIEQADYRNRDKYRFGKNELS